MQNLFEDYDFEGQKLARQYRSTIKRIDAEDVLDRYGAENVTLINSSRGEQLQHSCLIDRVDPHHTHGDSSPSATLHVEQKLYHCFSYGGGDLFWFLQVMEQADDKQGIYPVLSELVGDIVANDADFLTEIEDLLNPKEASVEPLPRYAKKVLEPWKLFHPYMYEDRGISKSVLEAHSVGYDAEEVKIVLPHFWDGKLVGWQKRSLTSAKYPKTPMVEREDGTLEEGPKYKSTYGFPKDRTLFTSQELTSDDFEAHAKGSVLVVESIASVLRAETLAGDEKLLDKHTGLLRRCVATFGAKVTNEQIRLLRGFESVTLWFDDDFAGKVAVLNVSRKLEKYTRVYIVDESKFDGDLADLSGSLVKHALSTAEPAVLGTMRAQKQLEKIKATMKTRKK